VEEDGLTEWVNQQQRDKADSTQNNGKNAVPPTNDHLTLNANSRDDQGLVRRGSQHFITGGEVEFTRGNHDDDDDEDGIGSESDDDTLMINAFATDEGQSVLVQRHNRGKRPQRNDQNGQKNAGAGHQGSGAENHSNNNQHRRSSFVLARHSAATTDPPLGHGDPRPSGVEFGGVALPGMTSDARRTSVVDAGTANPNTLPTLLTLPLLKTSTRWLPKSNNKNHHLQQDTRNHHQGNFVRHCPHSFNCLPLPLDPFLLSLTYRTSLYPTSVKSAVPASWGSYVGFVGHSGWALSGADAGELQQTIAQSTLISNQFLFPINPSSIHITIPSSIVYDGQRFDLSTHKAQNDAVEPRPNSLTPSQIAFNLRHLPPTSMHHHNLVITTF
jgi:hypothetical protein